jgi:acetyl esterase/lipase
MIDRRRLLSQSMLGAATIAMGWPAGLFAAEDPYLHLVNPELRQMAAGVASLTGNIVYTRDSILQMRKGAAAMGRSPRTDVPLERKVIAGSRGQPEVTIYIINSRPGESRPAILHMHGGGYFMGAAAQNIRDLQDLCSELGCAAVSVDYRLAPETDYTGSIEDNYAGLKWLHANAASIGADPARIAVMGESAGGAHAALLAIAARDRGEVPVIFQQLLYPMLDDRTGSSRQAAAHVGRLVWTPASNQFGWESFLGRPPGGRNIPAAAVPARVKDLSGLPPAFIGVGSIDLFHDEDVDYAQRLNAAGVSTQLILVPGAFHGFDIFTQFAPNLRLVEWFNRAKTDALRRGLGLPA